MNTRELFFRHVGQTSQFPAGLEIEKAEGIYLFDNRGKAYIDLMSGVSVSNIGHRHPDVVKAIKQQVDKYLHVMVYGEYIQSPQAELAQKLSELLPETIDNIYFVNSGSEAIEGALKLAKRATGRFNIVSFKNAYHGGTHGALSVMGCETTRNTFRPLLPGVRQIDYNTPAQLTAIDKSTACILIEPIQAEGGIIIPDKSYLQMVRERCNDTGTLLIFDEIQTGLGRTGTMFACESFGVTPDIICLAKALGGGLPLGAFASNRELMTQLTYNPPLGHITTFGGHPVSCAAALASIKVLVDNRLPEKSVKKGQLFMKLLKHNTIATTRGKGLFIAVDIKPSIDLFDLMQKAMEQGVLIDPFLFHPNSFRIAPPLTITENEIEEACQRILSALDEVEKTAP